MEANPQTSTHHALLGAVLGLAAAMLLTALGLGVWAATALFLAVAAAILGTQPSEVAAKASSHARPPTNLLPPTASPRSSPCGSDDLRSWLRRRSGRGPLDVPFRQLAIDASGDLGRWVGVEELAGMLERMDAERALARTAVRR